MVCVNKFAFTLWSHLLPRYNSPWTLMWTHLYSKYSHQNSGSVPLLGYKVSTLYGLGSLEYQCLNATLFWSSAQAPVLNTVKPLRMTGTQINNSKNVLDHALSLLDAFFTTLILEWKGSIILYSGGGNKRSSLQSKRCNESGEFGMMFSWWIFPSLTT